jgi:hypothetical protein
MSLCEPVEGGVVFGGEPVAEVNRHGQGLLGAQERRVGNRAHRQQPLLQAPPDEAGDHLAVVVGGDAVQLRGGPRLEPGKTLVT